MILAAIAALVMQAPTPAQQHRLEWVKQPDGSVATAKRIGGIAVKATCRAEGKVRCIVVRELVPGHIAVRQFEGDRLPVHTIGLMGEPAGYGCDWIGSSRTFVERIASGRDGVPPVAEKVTPEGGVTWTQAEVEALGGRYFECKSKLMQIDTE